VPRPENLAHGPTDLPARSWPETLRRTGQQLVEDNLLQWAAALAFFAVISLFPALLAIVSLLGLLGSSAIEPLIANVSELAPGAARDITLGALQNIERSASGSGPAFALALLVALWSASAYVGAFIPAANVVWEVEDARPLWKKLVVRLALTVVLLTLIVATALSVVFTGPIARQVGDVVGLGDEAVDVWSLGKWPFLALVMMLLLAILYWAAPNVRHPGWRWVSPGSALAVVLWIAGSLAFTAYVSNFGSYNATYGAIGGVLVFLLWLWVTNLAILLGAELNAEIERTRAIEGGMRPRDRTPFLEQRDGGEPTA
jgi:membrane protein